MANISLLTKASRLSEKSPTGAQLLLDLSAAETSADVLAALSKFDLAEANKSM